jgi:hypothetical protein
MAQSSKQDLSPLRSWDRFSLLSHLQDVVVFPQVLRFPPTGNVDRVGWDKPLTDPSTVVVLDNQT